MRSAPRGYMQSFQCEAPTGALWNALMKPDVLAVWYADDALIEPWEGGRYWVRTRLLGQREARIDAFEPGRRLRLLYDPNPDWPPAGNEVLVEDFMIHPAAAGRSDVSVLRLLGSGVPESVAWNATLKRLRSAWAVSFSYLQRHLEERGHRAMVAPYG